MNEKNELVLFKSKDGQVSLPVTLERETVWLSQRQMADLFWKDRTVIGRHIRNAIDEGEIDASTMCAKFANTTRVAHYRTPKGFDDLLMSSDGTSLTGLWFEGSPDATMHAERGVMRDLPVFRETAAWLDAYFAGRPPETCPRFRIDDLTPFRAAVVEEIQCIPFGRILTYGEIAARAAKRLGRERMSAQAVGGALVGYGGGLANKVALLWYESLSVMPVRLSCDGLQSAGRDGQSRFSMGISRKCASRL